MFPAPHLPTLPQTVSNQVKRRGSCLFCSLQILLSCSVKPSTEHSTSGVSPHLPQPAGDAPSEAAWRLLAFFSTWAHRWLVVSLLSTRTPSSFSGKMLSSQLAPVLDGYMGLFLPRGRTGHFPLLSMMRFLSGQCSSLLRSL